jgi:hypothetical protein
MDNLYGPTEMDLIQWRVKNGKELILIRINFM